MPPSDWSLKSSLLPLGTEQVGNQLFLLLQAQERFPRRLDPMASWKSSWWLLMWMVFMHSALLQVTCRARRMTGIPLLA